MNICFIIIGDQGEKGDPGVPGVCLCQYSLTFKKMVYSLISLLMTSHCLKSCDVFYYLFL